MNASAYVALLEETLSKIGFLAKGANLSTAALVLQVIGHVVEKIQAAADGRLHVGDAKAFVEQAMKPLLDGLATNDAEIDRLLQEKRKLET